MSTSICYRHSFKHDADCCLNQVEEEIYYHTAQHMIAQSDIALKLSNPQCCFILNWSTSVLDLRVESSQIIMGTKNTVSQRWNGVLLLEQSPLNSIIIIMMTVMRLRLWLHCVFLALHLQTVACILDWLCKTWQTLKIFRQSADFNYFLLCNIFYTSHIQ